LVISRQGLGATDPRDFLFSHAGFAFDAPDPMIKVDYSKSCAQVYSDFARYEIEKSGNFNILSRVSDIPLDERMEGLPSWAPDWSKSAPSSELFLDRTVANSGMPEPCIIKFEQSHLWIQDPPILAHISSQLDIVVGLSVEFSVDLMPARKRRNFEAKFAAMMKDEQFLSDEDYEKVFLEVYKAWRNILGRDILPELPDDQPIETFFGHLDVRNIRDLEDLPSYLVNRLDQRYPSFLDGRKVAILASGKLAVVPSSTCRGDIVINGYLPWIVRPLDLENMSPFDSKIRHQFGGLFHRIFRHQVDRELNLQWPVEHCAFIGEGWMECFSSHITRPGVRGEHRNYAIH
jgi:hypothetical protein